MHHGALDPVAGANDLVAIEKRQDKQSSKASQSYYIVSGRGAYLYFWVPIAS
jgi:hypothetical protein